jgi:hypothetical protein
MQMQSEGKGWDAEDLQEVKTLNFKVEKTDGESLEIAEIASSKLVKKSSRGHNRVDYLRKVIFNRLKGTIKCTCPKASVASKCVHIFAALTLQIDTLDYDKEEHFCELMRQHLSTIVPLLIQLEFDKCMDVKFNRHVIGAIQQITASATPSTPSWSDRSPVTPATAMSCASTPIAPPSKLLSTRTWDGPPSSRVSCGSADSDCGPGYSRAPSTSAAQPYTLAAPDSDADGAGDSDESNAVIEAGSAGTGGGDGRQRSQARRRLTPGGTPDEAPVPDLKRRRSLSPTAPA